MENFGTYLYSNRSTIQVHGAQEYVSTLAQISSSSQLKSVPEFLTESPVRKSAYIMSNTNIYSGWIVRPHKSRQIIYISFHSSECA